MGSHLLSRLSFFQKRYRGPGMIIALSPPTTKRALLRAVLGMYSVLVSAAPPNPRTRMSSSLLSWKSARTSLSWVAIYYITQHTGYSLLPSSQCHRLPHSSPCRVPLKMKSAEPRTHCGVRSGVHRGGPIPIKGVRCADPH